MKKNKLPHNFWDDLKKEFPAIMEHFGQWIDEYKNEVAWDILFANGNWVTIDDGSTTEVIKKRKYQQDIKFHDLPLEMQQGILIRYTGESAAYHAVNESSDGEFFSFVGSLQQLYGSEVERKCRKCGCTDEDCSQCIRKTGHPCSWVEEDLCSACVEEEPGASLLLPGRDF